MRFCALGFRGIFALLLILHVVLGVNLGYRSFSDYPHEEYGLDSEPEDGRYDERGGGSYSRTHQKRRGGGRSRGDRYVYDDGYDDDSMTYRSPGQRRHSRSKYDMENIVGAHGTSFLETEPEITRRYRRKDRYADDTYEDAGLEARLVDDDIHQRKRDYLYSIKMRKDTNKEPLLPDLPAPPVV